MPSKWWRILVVATCISFSSLLVPQASGQTPPPSSIQEQSWVLTERARVEDRVARQVAGVVNLLQVGAVIVAIVLGIFTLWGFSNYRSLMHEVRDKFNDRMTTLTRLHSEMEDKVKTSEGLLQGIKTMADLEESKGPWVLLARAREAFHRRPPNYTEAVAFVSKLLTLPNVSGHDLTNAGLLARECGASGLAKLMLRKALDTDAPYTARAVLAELCAKDPDWHEHKKILDDLLNERYADETILAATANFYLQREDWSGLEAAMAKAESAAPFSVIPSRNRALAAGKLGRDKDEVVAHFDRTLMKPSGPTDATTMAWFANYLWRGGYPRTERDSERVAELFEGVLFVNPEDGDERIRYAKFLYKDGRPADAIRHLRVALAFSQSPTLRLEGSALLTLWTGEDQDGVEIALANAIEGEESA